MEIIFLTIILGATILLALYIGKIFKPSQKEEAIAEDNDKEEEDTKQEKEVTTAKTKKKVADKKMKEKAPTFHHPWLVSTLKGHSGRVVDMEISPNGKHLASSGEDRTVMVWSTKGFVEKEHKVLRCNVEYDHGLFVKWSPDSKAFVVQKAVQNCTEVYKMSKKADGSLGDFSVAVTFPAKHKTDIIGMGISATGKFIATCSDKTDLIVWSLKGEVLDRIDTVHNLTYCCKVSPCGRFVATSGFTPDVKVWEVKFSRSGEFEKVARAFDLTGHSSGVYSFSFSADSGRMATVSKDGTWKVFDTAVEFAKGQDPTVIMSGSYPWDNNMPSKITISPDGAVVVLSHDKSLAFYSVLTGADAGTVTGVHTEPVSQTIFSSDSQLVLSAGDKHVKILHNVPGIRIKIQELAAALQKNLSNSAAKDRIEKQIKDAEAALLAIEG